MNDSHLFRLSIIGFLLLASLTACEQLGLGGKAALPGSVQPEIPPSMLEKLGIEFYDWEIDRQKEMKRIEKREDVVKAMDHIFMQLKEAALKHPKYGEVAKELEEDKDWKLNTIQDTKTLAVGYPGGGIAIYEGIFEVAENHGALAGILGHEMGHVLARHAAKRFTGDAAAAVTTIGPSIASGINPDKMDPKVVAPIAVALGAGYLVPGGVRQTWAHAQEEDADCIGLSLAAKAGYDPDKILGFWRRMHEKETEANEKYDFLKTHPMNKARFTHIEKQCMSEAITLYDNVTSDKRQNASAPLPPGVTGPA